MDTFPYHDGEIAVQEKVGERDRAILNGRVVQGEVPIGAVPFVHRQSLCVLGRVIEEGEIWAVLIADEPGFASVDDERKCLLLKTGDRAPDNTPLPFFQDLRAGDQLGCLFIELSTRRRLRVNGSVRQFANGCLSLNVDQAYPNCPKYIQRRRADMNPDHLTAANPKTGEELTDEIRRWIARADTFFVASAHPDGACDVSHRGGNSGFIRMQNDGTLTIPDYPGNSMFNTFGNLFLYPKAGLLFIDFENNRQLHLTGTVELRLDLPKSAAEGEVSGRSWNFIPRKWVISRFSKALRWEFVDNSPFNPAT